MTNEKCLMTKNIQSKPRLARKPPYDSRKGRVTKGIFHHNVRERNPPSSLPASAKRWRMAESSWGQAPLLLKGEGKTKPRLQSVHSVRKRMVEPSLFFKESTLCDMMMVCFLRVGRVSAGGEIYFLGLNPFTAFPKGSLRDAELPQGSMLFVTSL